MKIHMMFRETALFLTPLLLTGLFHHLVVVRRDWFAALTTPIDAGAVWRGKRIFGDNKTWRGLAVFAFCTMITFICMHRVIPLPLRASPWVVGLLLGAGYVLGELPNSLLKRRLGIAPGARAEGMQGTIFGIFDHIDSVTGALLAVAFLYAASPMLLLALFLCGTVLHVTVDTYLHRSGYKKDRALTAVTIPSPAALPRRE